MTESLWVHSPCQRALRAVSTSVCSLSPSNQSLVFLRWRSSESLFSTTEQSPPEHGSSALCCFPSCHLRTQFMLYLCSLKHTPSLSLPALIPLLPHVSLCLSSAPLNSQALTLCIVFFHLKPVDMWPIKMQTWSFILYLQLMWPGAAVQQREVSVSSDSLTPDALQPSVLFQSSLNFSLMHALVYIVHAWINKRNNNLIMCAHCCLCV